jgi:ATP-binding cassette subfamily C protein LapB
VGNSLQAAVQDALAEPAGPEGSPAQRKADPLLGALQYLARRWGRPVSRDVLLAGLPLKDGLLTVKLLPRALERIGLTQQPKRVALRDLAEFDMPALIISRKGVPLVIVGRI